MTPSNVPIPDPDCRQLGTTFIVSWPAAHLVFHASRLREYGDNVSCELHVTHEGHTVDLFRLSLLSARERSAASNHLRDRMGGIDWANYVTAFSIRLLDAYRKETPAEDSALGDPPLITSLVSPTLKRGGLGVLFGDYGKGKTLIAYGHAVAVAYTDVSLTNLEAHDHGPVMIIDYEMGMDQAKATIRAILAGFGLTPQPGKIYLRHLIHPLSDSAETLRTEIAKLKCILTIVDSQSQAAPHNGQGDPAGPVRELVRTLNTFETTNLLIGQVSKIESRFEGAREPYGSRHISYLADDTWETRGRWDDETRTLTTTLYHRKHRGAYSPPLGFLATFPQAGVITLAETLPPSDDTRPEATAKEKPTGRRAGCIGALVILSQATPTQVAAHLGLDPTNPEIRKRLRTDLGWLAREGWIRQISAGKAGRQPIEPVFGPLAAEHS
jgi:hypothetical protein